MIPLCLIGLSLVLFGVSCLNLRGQPTGTCQSYSYSKVVIVPMQVGILIFGGLFFGIYESFSGPMSRLDSLAVAALGSVFACVMCLAAITYKALTIAVTPAALVVKRLIGTTSVPWNVVSVIERRPKYRASELVSLRDTQGHTLFEVDSAIAEFYDFVDALEEKAPKGTLVRERDRRGNWRERTT